MNKKLEILQKASNYYYANTFSQSVVAKKFLLNQPTLSAYIKQDKRFNKTTISTRNSRAVKKIYTDKQKQDASQEFINGENVAVLANKYDCSESSIRYWAKNIKHEKRISIIKTPELETLRKQMYEELKKEFVSLSSIIEETEQKRLVIHDRMTYIGETWNL